MQRLKNACPVPPNELYLITWFISGLNSSIKREMKKAQRCATFVAATKVAMDIEDEGSVSDDATTFEPVHLENSTVHVEDRTRPSDGQALVDVVVKATREEWQNERESFVDSLIQTIESKIRIVGHAQ